jgi:hypothetical protein
MDTTAHRRCSATLLGIFAVMNACKKPSSDSPLPTAPPKISRLDPVTRADASAEETLYDVAPFSPLGSAAPKDAITLTLSDLANAPTLDSKRPVLIVVNDDEVYMAQLGQLLSTLDSNKSEVWLKHPRVDAAYAVELKDERTFQAWLDDLKPGKLRVIQRADGFELQTNMGKLGGVDPNGPSVPNRGGKADLATLQDGLIKIKGRFKEATDLCFVPSHGMSIAQVVEALAANMTPKGAVFDRTCLVYAKPAAQR